METNVSDSIHESSALYCVCAVGRLRYIAASGT